MRSKFLFALLCYALVSTLSIFAADQLVISELSASDGPLEDEDGDGTDWIEIHNVGTNTVNLNGWYLTDSAANLAKWRFPATNVPPNGYLLVYASNKDRKVAGRPLHTNFRLDANGEYLALVQPDGATIAYAYSPKFPVQVTGISYGIPLQQSFVTLVPTGAAARVFVPANDSLGLSWTAVEFNDSAWTSAQTGIGYETDADASTNTVVADSVADWSISGTQGEKNWYYGYYNRTIDAGGVYATNDFILFPRGAGPYSAQNYWNGTIWNWFNGDPPWDEIGQTGCHPNGINNPAGGAGGEHWVIRRWVSEVSGTITVTWTLKKTNLNGTGTTGHLFHNGVQQDVATVAGNDGVGVNRTVTITNVHVGDFIDLALDPTGIGGDSSDGSDGSAMTMVVRGSPSLSDSIASNIQAQMQNVNASAYIRIPFVVTNASSIRTLTLRIKYDDGFVANINGVFVADRFPPLQGDPLTWNSPASTNRFDGDVNQWDTIDISEYAGALHDGTNVLAIHGMNAAANDADFLILPELRAGVVGAELAPAYFTTPTPGVANGLGSTNLGPIIKEVVHTPNVPRDNEDLYVTAQITPTFNAISNVLLVYRVMFSNEVSTPMLDDGAHGDGLAGDGVYGALIPATAARIGEMVRYYIYATDIRTNRMRVPQYDPLINAANAPEYLGTVVDVPQTNGLPIFHLFIPDAILQQANNNSANTPRYPCAIFYLGEFYDNCAINRHGQSSTGFPKKSYDIDFNPGHSFKWKEGEERVDDINMLTTYPDKSHMRNILGYDIFKDAGAPYHYVEIVRIHTNGGFYGTWHMLENGDDNYLKRIGRDPNGALYKMYNTFLDPSDYTISSSEAEKKTRKTEGNADLVALFNGVNNASLAVRTNYMYDNIDIAEVLNQLASRTVTSDWDCCHKNYYFYRDSDNTGEWQAMPWDIDLSFGRNWSSTQSYWDDAVYPANRIWGNWDNNGFFQLVMNMPAGRGIDATRQMYLRRVRTLMDEIQQTNGTPYAQLRFENQMDQLAAKIAPDAAMDLLKWGTWGGGNTGIFDTNNQYYRTLPQEIQRIKTNYMPARRTFIFNQYMGLSGGDLINFTNSQPTNVVIRIGALDYNPSSANQAEEYIELINTNRIAVDISGWKLSGAVEHTFQGGVVIPSSNKVYVVNNKKAFRNRAVAPKGGMGLYVEGEYKGQLSARGEALLLTDKRGRLVVSNSYVGNPSLPQQYLRITEIMYHPAPPASGSPYTSEDFEYLELKNTGPSVMNLTGVHFTNGVEFVFAAPGVTNLGPGGTVILARNPTALAARYPTATNIVGPYLGSLDNNGENIRLDDAVGEKILDFSYNNSWYPMTDGNGFSLVIVNEAAPFYTWDLKESWRPSGVFNGSPGTNDTTQPAFAGILVNEVLTHTDFPTVDAIEIYNPTTNAVDIGDWWISDDFSTPQKYRIPAPHVIPAGGFSVFTEADFNLGPNAFSFSSQGDEAYIFSGNSAGQLSGYFQGYQFGAGANGVTFGRYTNSQAEVHFVAMSSNTFNFANARPKVGPIVISEIMYHPSDITSATNILDNTLEEFIELHNIGTNAVSLFDPAAPTNRWKLDNAVQFSFPTNAVVPAGGYMIAVSFNPLTNAAAADAFRIKYGVPTNVPLFGPYSGKLDNSDESIELYRPDSPDTNTVPYVLVEKVHYRDLPPWDSAADGFGLSLQRQVHADYANDPTNWFAALPNAGGPSSTGSRPTITQQPQDIIIVQGRSTNMSVTVSGTAPLAYQWQRNGINLQNETNATLTFTNIQLSQTGSYSVVVYNVAGAAFSSNAIVTVRPLPVILQQPAEQKVQPGTNVTFSVLVSGTPPITYQWRFNGQNIPNATNASYSFVNADLFTHCGFYDVIIQDDVASVTSSVATLYVLVRPVITNQPVAVNVVPGGTAVFSITAGPTHPLMPLAYRWIRGGTPYITSSVPVLVLTNVQASASIRCAVTNLATGLGGLNSATVQMTVVPDFDGDGIADSWEALYGMNTNSIADGLLDLDGDGMSNRDEYVAGTDPTNGLSVLRLTINPTNQQLLQFVAQSNISYSVQYRTNLTTAPWTPAMTLVPQSLPARTISVEVPALPPNWSSFYRVVTPLVP